MYNVKDGWDPLCKFLDVPIPNIPFPHKNKKGEIIDDLIKTNPVFKQIQKEAFLSIGCIGIGLCYVCIKAVKYYLTKTNL